MDDLPLVSCLMATHGRFSEVAHAIYDFTAQDYPNRELVILNNHPVPLQYDANESPENVRIINEPGHATLGDCRNRLLQEARGEYVRTWDDDDAYLPWTISQGVAHIGDAVAFKPLRSWFDCEGEGFRLEDNVFEAAMLTRREFVLKHPYKSGAGDEHQGLVEAVHHSGQLNRRNMDVFASYIYRWGHGVHHISGSMGHGTTESRTRFWQQENQSHGGGASLGLAVAAAEDDRRSLYRKLSQYTAAYRTEFELRASREIPEGSTPHGVKIDNPHTIATRKITQEKFCALEFGRGESTRQLLKNQLVGLLISVDPDIKTFDEVKSGLTMADMNRIQMLGDLGECLGCQQLKCSPNYLTLNTGSAMKNLNAFLAVARKLASEARISVLASDGYLVRTVLEPTHTTAKIGDYLVFSPRVIPENLRWPPSVSPRISK